MGESKFALSCLWYPERLRVCADGVRGWLHPLRAGGATGVAGVSTMPQRRSEPQGQAVSAVANRADRLQARVAGDRGAPVPVSGVRPELRGCPPFAPAYVAYTDRLQAFVEGLWGRMTVTDLAALTGLGWDTVKNIIKARLEQDYGHPRLRPLKRLSIDEIYFGRHKKFYTLVIDLDTGQIVWGGQGEGRRGFAPLLAGLAFEPCPDRGGGYGHEPRLLGGRAGASAGGGDRVRPVPPHQAGQRETGRPAPRDGSRSHRPDEADRQRNPLPAADASRQHRRGETATPRRGSQTQRTAAHRLSAQRGLGVALGATHLWSNEGVPRRVVRLGRRIGHSPDAAVGQDPAQPQKRHSFVVETPDQQRPNGRHQQ